MKTHVLNVGARERLLEVFAVATLQAAMALSPKVTAHDLAVICYDVAEAMVAEHETRISGEPA